MSFGSERTPDEKISAFLDLELDGGEKQRMLQQFETDVELRAQLVRYRMIGDALRGERLQPGAMGILDAVRDRLQEEPVILAPTRKPQRPNWLQPAVGLALAASVAAIGVIVAPWLLGPTGEGATRGVGATLAERAELPVQMVSSQGTRWKTLNPGLEQRLNGYLEEHSENAGAMGGQGVIPYTNFVSYDGR